jgi:hypothetical protein
MKEMMIRASNQKSSIITTWADIFSLGKSGIPSDMLHPVLVSGDESHQYTIVEQDMKKYLTTMQTTDSLSRILTKTSTIHGVSVTDHFSRYISGEEKFLDKHTQL